MELLIAKSENSAFIFGPRVFVGMDVIFSDEQENSKITPFLDAWRNVIDNINESVGGIDLKAHKLKGRAQELQFQSVSLIHKKKSIENFQFSAYEVKPYTVRPLQLLKYEFTPQEFFSAFCT